MRRDGDGNLRQWLLRSLVLVGVLALGWVIGRAGAGSAPGAEPTAVGSAAPSNGRTRAGIPVGFPDTPRGAAAAVAAYQDAFASPRILGAGVMRERIEAVATPDYAGEMLAANTPGRERSAAAPIGAGVVAGIQTLYSAVPIGYEVEAFTSERARILTWGFTLLGNAAAVEPTAYFGLTHTELSWVEDSWRISATRAGFGPTPRLASAPGPLGPYSVVDLASGLRSYDPAP